MSLYGIGQSRLCRISMNAPAGTVTVDAPADRVADMPRVPDALKNTVPLTSRTLADADGAIAPENRVVSVVAPIWYWVSVVPVHSFALKHAVPTAGPVNCSVYVPA